MASVFRKSYTYTHPKTGKKELRHNAKWYVKYKDADDVTRCVPGYTDKSATQELAGKLEREAELGRRGVIDPFREHRKTPLTTHLDEFIGHLRHKGDSEKHVGLIHDRVKATVGWCSFALMSDVSASKVTAFLGDLRSRGRSIETCNHYLSAFKQFCGWLVSDRRTSENPVSHLKKSNSKVDRRHDRRALTDDEFQRLVLAAESGSVVEGVCGADRAMIYVVAAWTGFDAENLRP